MSFTDYAAFTSTSFAGSKELYLMCEVVDILLCPRPVGGGALSDDARLTSELSRTSDLSREQRGLRRLKQAQM